MTRHTSSTPSLLSVGAMATHKVSVNSSKVKKQKTSSANYKEYVAG